MLPALRPFALLLFVCLLGACKAHVDRMAPFRGAWQNGDFVGADGQVNQLIAGEIGTTEEELAANPGLAAELDVEDGNNSLYALEKGMTLMALGEFDASAEVLARAQSYYDSHLATDFADGFTSILTDDESRQYVGNDHEHVALRLIEAFVELLRGGRQSISHALGVDEVQVRIIESNFGTLTDDGTDYQPRKSYKKLAIGSYLTGLLYEQDIQAKEAKRRFERARKWARFDQGLIEQGIARAEKGEFAPLGSGALNVFYLAGRGPYFIEAYDQASQSAVALARWGVALIGKSWSALWQKPVPVPKVLVSDPRITPLEVDVPGQGSTRTELMTDLNLIVAEQLQANMPGIQARAVVRRIVKATAAAAVEKSVSRKNNDWVGFFAGLVTNLALTSGERAETRCWQSLPAQLHVARIVLPEGEHRVELSDGAITTVRIRRGANSWLVHLRPRIDRKGVPLVDVHSRPLERSLPDEESQPAK